jgi:hypothetical protein
VDERLLTNKLPKKRRKIGSRRILTREKLNQKKSGITKTILQAELVATMIGIAVVRER